MEFFRTHGLGDGRALMLALITAYHLSDYMRGPMVNPYYQALAIPKLTVAGVRTTLGIGGDRSPAARRPRAVVSCLRLGVR